MKTSEDIRWLQRLQNFSRAMHLLRSVFEQQELNQLEQEGAIQRFVYTWELAWKTLKDFLEYNGLQIPQPIGARNVIKEAASAFFESVEIDGEIFMQMLISRNELSHTYNFAKFAQELEKIERLYLPQLEKLYDFFVEKMLEYEK
ncbi:MAG: nucleotidyltransferase substrate binding protein [Defluviitaleaceae bacterium]|nr:nucleotidyltransferase substrate binding protein [Defluviitaleaceae bacterium]